MGFFNILFGHSPTSGTCGKNLRWVFDYGGTLTISGYGDMESWNPYPLKTNPPWDTYRESIKKIFIAEGVTSIGEWAFSYCKSLIPVEIPNSVTSIGNYAFLWCESLTSIQIPNSVTYIGEGAFSGCKSLTSIQIPNSVTSIGYWAFSYCKSLTSIQIPNSVTSIGKFAFSDCGLLTSIQIPNSVTSIGDWAFSDCGLLTSIQIPNSVTSIGDWAFDCCKSLKEIYYPAGRGFEKILSEGNSAKLIPYNVELPVDKQKAVVKQAEQIREKLLPLWWEERLKHIANKLQWKVEGKTLTVGGVSEIKSYSYEATPWRDNLRDIQRIIIEDGVKKISANAFAECTRLEQLTIPASVKTIGDGAFTFCYCGDRTINGGRNVIWSLDNGTLMIKKNPAAKNESNFSTGYETWQVVEGNITSVKIERGIVPGKNFFDWLGRMGDGVTVTF